MNDEERCPDCNNVACECPKQATTVTPFFNEREEEMEEED
jgi:hypothetical protein